MKHALCFAVLLLSLCPAFAEDIAKRLPHPDMEAIRGTAGIPAPVVLFSPKGGIAKAITDRIAAAKTSIRVQAYSFTSHAIIKALTDAKGRGVDVKVLLDRQWNTKSPQGANALKLAAIPVLFDGKHPIAHNKIIVIDETLTITGSYNYTAQAETNAENIVIINDPMTAQKFLNNWSDHATHSAGL
jgi:phosphatidylserine/phosphatidylglycerophosphate/cardiolipin synthase-like enzyme